MRRHFDFDKIEEYHRNKIYPSTIPAQDYAFKSNFRRAATVYAVKDGHLFYKKGIGIKDKERQMEIITCTEVLEIQDTPRQWPPIEKKTLRKTRLHKDFSGIVLLLIPVNILKVAKNKVT